MIGFITFNLKTLRHKNLRWLLRRGSPLPIPNREVKPDCADGTAICGRVCRRLFLLKPQSVKIGVFCFIAAASLFGYLEKLGSTSL